MSPVIELRDVKRRFGAREVLRGVTAEASEGRIIGLLGRNGEGKTTLFRILLDILARDSGTVRVLGRSPDGSAEIRRLAGYVPERPAFHDSMTVGEVLSYRKGHFPAWNDEKAGQLLQRLKLDADTRIRGASKGTLGKLAWVCAVAHDPRILFLDEPTSGLDALVREEVLGALITELQEAGRTIVVASHRMEEFAGLLDEVWVLSDGVIAASHEMQALRAAACRVRGRLKEGRSLPEDPRLIDACVEGAVADFAALDGKPFEDLRASGVFESAEKVPLPADAIMRLLLKRY